MFIFSIVPLDLYAPKYLFRKTLEAEESNIEYSIVSNGLFMDYLLPKGKKTYAKDVVIPVNPEERTASIPGTLIMRMSWRKNELLLNFVPPLLDRIFPFKNLRN